MTVRRIDRLVGRLLAASGWDQTRRLLGRHAGLSSPAAEARLAGLAGRAEAAGDHDAAAMYRMHQVLVQRSRAAGPDQAVASLRADLDLVPELTARAAAAYRRFGHDGSPADLAAAIEQLERAAAVAGSWHPERAAVLNNLGLAWSDRAATEDRQPDDLNRSITALEAAMSISAPGQDERSAVLTNLGAALLVRRHPADLERAAAVLGEAASLAADPAERARRLSNLGIALSEGYLASARPDQLERAVSAYAESAALSAPDSAGHMSRLVNLGTGLAERYVLRGDPADLDRAIDLMTQAVAAVTAEDDSDLADWLDNLGLLLRDRYLRDGDLADLDAAEQRLAAARDLTPPGAPARAGRLDQYATTLRMRAVRRDDPAELDRAVGLHRDAARPGGAGPQERGRILSNLGGTLRALAHYPGHEQVLGEAIEAYQAALGLVQPAERGAVLTNLGAALLDRYDQAPDGAGLGQAIEVLAESARITDPDSPEWPGRMNNLANGLRRRFERTEDAADAELAADTYRRAQRRALEVAAGTALRCGINWGGWSVRRGDWARAHEAYDRARVAADRLLRLHLVRRDVEAWLTEVEDLPAQAAFARVQTGEPRQAAEWAEWGRARVLSDALDRARLAGLAASHPALVRRYQQAAARLMARDGTGSADQPA